MPYPTRPLDWPTATSPRSSRTSSASRFRPAAAIFKAGSESRLLLPDRSAARSASSSIAASSTPRTSSDLLEPGWILGELGFLDGMPRSASALAQTDVEARKILKAGHRSAADDRPAAAAALYRLLGRNAAQKLRDMNERFADAVFTGRDPEIDELVDRAAAAQQQIEDWPEARIDALLLTMAQAFAVCARELAEATVRVTAHRQRAGQGRRRISSRAWASIARWPVSRASGVLEHRRGAEGERDRRAGRRRRRTDPDDQPGGHRHLQGADRHQGTQRPDPELSAHHRELGTRVGPIIQDALDARRRPRRSRAVDQAQQFPQEDRDPDEPSRASRSSSPPAARAW